MLFPCWNKDRTNTRKEFSGHHIFFKFFFYEPALCILNQFDEERMKQLLSQGLLQKVSSQEDASEKLILET